MIISVSVPLWGSFNLTVRYLFGENNYCQGRVSVPLWGSFNLTQGFTDEQLEVFKFPSPNGDHLI